jgi:UDP-glucose 4-epimerase
LEFLKAGHDEANTSPLDESMPTGMPSNNYGYTKLIVEQLLQKLAIADSRWSIALLRYFNPVGAHNSGRIGEDPQGIPNNLMPYLTQVAVGRREKLSIFGNDYATQDGTCERDFIHVVDLAKAHVLAVENRFQNTGCRAWNIGTGQPISVLKIKNTFEKVNNICIASEFVSRRAGDLSSFFANASRANSELGWTAKYTLEDMLVDSWNWQKQNPTGYQS